MSRPIKRSDLVAIIIALIFTLWLWLIAIPTVIHQPR